MGPLGFEFDKYTEFDSTSINVLTRLILHKQTPLWDYNIPGVMLKSQVPGRTANAPHITSSVTVLSLGLGVTITQVTGLRRLLHRKLLESRSSPYKFLLELALSGALVGGFNSGVSVSLTVWHQQQLTTPLGAGRLRNGRLRFSTRADGSFRFEAGFVQGLSPGERALSRLLYVVGRSRVANISTWCYPLPRYV